jgi:outer membrane protein TolC
MRRTAGWIIACWVCLCSENSVAQTLSYKEYLYWVLQEHPIAKNAQIISQKREAVYDQTKGILDPVLVSKWKQKAMGDTKYYNQSQTSIAVQTPFALQFIGQVDVNNGSYLNPENYTGKDGLLTMGIALPILQGLVIDETRLSLRRAELLQSMSLLEKQMAINELLFQSTILYLDWWTAERRQSVSNELLSVAQDRLNAVRTRFEMGDRSAMDTLEAHAQYQSRWMNWQDAQIVVIKSRLALVAFADEQDGKKNILALNVSPDFTELAQLQSAGSSIITQETLMGHPEIQWYSSKIKMLEWEEKWKREKLKPKLNVQYNFLKQGIDSQNQNQFAMNNYRWGIDFAFPIFLRDARGDLQLQRLKIDESNNDREWKVNSIAQKAQAFDQQIAVLNNQIQSAEKNAKAYRQLWQAEQMRFLNGESNVFMVNQRENNWLESETKTIDYQRKWIESKAQKIQLMYLPYN